MTRAVLFARDPGAANHVTAVAEVLAGRLTCDPLLRLLTDLAGRTPEDFALWGQGPALSVFAAAGLVADGPALDDAEAVARLLCGARADILVTGTGDVDDGATRLLWGAARTLGVPSVAALDSADNLEFRFNLDHRPDRVIAPDPVSAARLRERGFADPDIVVLDNLHHTRLRRQAPAGRERVRRDWGVVPDLRVVLFVSENAAEARQMGRPVQYNEFALVDKLIREVAARRPVGPLGPEGGEVVIVVRPHPRDLPGKYDGYRRSSGPRLIVSAAGSPAEAVFGADLVVGMRSALLDEAQILGRPVHRLLGQGEYCSFNDPDRLTEIDRG